VITAVTTWITLVRYESKRNLTGIRIGEWLAMSALWRITADEGHSTTMKGLSNRLQRLEQKCLTSEEHNGIEVKAAEHRLMRGAVAGLTTAELQHIADFIEMQAANSGAPPNTEQQAALESYERHYRGFLTAGRLQTIRGWPVDYSGRMPEVNGCAAGVYLDGSWWVEGIGY